MQSEPFKIPMPPGVERVETGAIQFGDDWPSVHIRGDNAAYYAMNLRCLLDHCDARADSEQSHVLGLMVLRGLLSTLEGCIVQPKT